MRRIFVPGDSGARSVGADDVAAAVTAHAPHIPIVRNGSRGLYWLEPLLEIEGEDGRIAFGPVGPEDVPAILAQGRTHPLCLGPPDLIPFLARQQRLTFARVGVTDPLSLDDYRAHGGWGGLEKAARMAPADIVEAVVASGLRGRGGAGFPTGLKWRTVAAAPADRRYVVCNADEGDSGTFADRMLLEGDPFLLVEGMAIAGLAVGAAQGYVYIRSEYPDAFATFSAAIRLAEAAGFLGDDVAGSGRPFRLEARLGAGAYICGEETALLESLEGRRGVIRPKPPLPAIRGLFGKPTIVNNVLSLAAIPLILDKGPEHYAALGLARSRGTQPFQLAGNLKHCGLVEVAFGLTIRQLVEDFGGGTASGRPLRAVQVGGPLGAYFPESLLDVPLDYEAMAAAGGMLGHGGIVAFDDRVDMGAQARFAFAFCAAESCGKCTPCRIGSTRGVEVLDRIRSGQNMAGNLDLLHDLLETMRDGSLCALGGLTPLPVESALRHFPDDFGRPARVAAE
ncbi:NADH-ubiquinone oxidoreductase-F iron-sulfur binding region domain-containing protein [Zavarzinia sp. CC-PAN008]|uniref:NADH-ubiquinone oxidoreductase-F iron-sulfur binding region domain-containing protein n=1 Tax=Zavarzinia sp. CC-PAN008 TaxID=3243332 RepID=UPI003F743F80